MWGSILGSPYFGKRPYHGTICGESMARSSGIETIRASLSRAEVRVARFKRVSCSNSGQGVLPMWSFHDEKAPG